MINGKRVIAVIPARGGSKKIPYKNIKPLAGKPLIGWTIDLAKSIQEIDLVVVSTDDVKIEKVANEYGAHVIKRPAELAQDDSLVIDALQDLIKQLKLTGDIFDIMVVLEPTCPLRGREDIIACLQKLADEEKRYDSVATFKEADLNPHRAWKIGKNEELTTFIEGVIPWLPRQKLPEAYQLNGAVYAFKIDSLPENNISLLFGKMGAVGMPKERSLDIDDEMDFLLVETFIKGMENHE